MPLPSSLSETLRRWCCDVLVIGAGPAGSCAARAAASAGARVILIDRRRQVGAPARCAGFIPAPALRLADHPRGVMAQRIESMITFTPDGGSFESATPGFIVNREALDRSLAGAAGKAGARVIMGARAVSRRGRTTMIKLEQGTVEVESAVTIGADGPVSVAGSWIGSVNTGLLVGTQWTVPLNEPSSAIRIYFNSRLPGGYGWLFPKGSEANVGVGLEMGVGLRPRMALKWFVSRLATEGIIKANALSVTGGHIPVGGPLASHAGSLLLAGDAAGLCQPLTGAGISLAMQSGRLAGDAAAVAALGEGPAALPRYSEEIDDLMGEYLRKAAHGRRRLYRHASGPAADFSRAVRKEWIAFPSGSTTMVQ